MSLALFTICLISGMYGSEAGGGQCKISERSFPGKALKGHTFKEFAVRAIVECQNTCERDPRCASYNFYIPGKVCELNSQTKEERPEDFVTDELRFYMRREGTIICLFSPVYFLVLLMELRTCECQNTITKFQDANRIRLPCIVCATLGSCTNKIHTLHDLDLEITHIFAMLKSVLYH